MKKKVESLVVELVGLKKPSLLAVEKAKKKWAKAQGVGLPKNFQLLGAYKNLVKTKKIRPNSKLENLLLAKPVRTLSGVAPVTVILKPAGCSGDCVYCPNQKGVPKSYLDDEPAVLRARQFEYDPHSQMKYRLEVFEKMGHSAQKVELIILGGTFSDYSKEYREEFIKKCFEAANGRRAKDLAAAQKTNQKASHRIVGLTIETRPDSVTDKEIRFWRELGVTRVEIGVQSLFERVLKKINRPHGIKEVMEATQKLRANGFKIVYHLMPGLPGSNRWLDYLIFVRAFFGQKFKPDYLKIYPCVVIEETKLYDWWKAGQYQPLKDEALVSRLARIKRIVPVWVRINRLGRDIPIGDIEAGFRQSHIRQLVAKRMKKKNWRCRCIRCREVRAKDYDPAKIKLRETRYLVNGGEEVFLEYVDDQERLYAFLRLFLPVGTKPVFKVLRRAGLVRELHTFGRSLSVGRLGGAESQHQGLGKKLLVRAEELSVKRGLKKMAVIAGVGVRDYYTKQGYELRETYMVKKI